MRTSVVVVTVCAALTIASCSRALRTVPVLPGPPPGIEALWEAPQSQTLDLRHGPGGPALAPRDRTFTFVAADQSGWSPGYDVKDASGVEWSVKLGPEAQSEVAASRILWAAGFHQPPTYYLPAWTLTGGGEPGEQQPARFRPTLPDEEIIGDWSWYENPFVGRREYGGLIVLNLMITNWDWKTSNNKIYRSTDEPGSPTRYVVRDVGAAFGRFTYPTILKWFRLRGFGQGTRNNLPDFEAQRFIKAVRDDGRVEFHYRGIYRDVVEGARVADVVWAARQLSVLSDRQWQDAFGAAGYTPEETARFVARMKSKIADGLALATHARASATTGNPRSRSTASTFSAEAGRGGTIGRR